MNNELLVRDLFRLTTGTTVLACEGADGIEISIAGRTAQLLLGDQLRQTILLLGERQMLNQTSSRFRRAIETNDEVTISVEEAQSGLCRIVIDS